MRWTRILVRLNRKFNRNGLVFLSERNHEQQRLASTNDKNGKRITPKFINNHFK